MPQETNAGLSATQLQLLLEAAKLAWEFCSFGHADGPIRWNQSDHFLTKLLPSFFGFDPRTNKLFEIVEKWWFIPCKWLYNIYIYSHQPSGWMIGPVSSGLSAFVKLQAQWLFESAANSVNVWQCLKMQKHKGLAQWNIGMFHWRSTREMDSYNSTIISHHIWYPGSSKWPRLNP